jgi:hypothetical protein
MNDTQSLEARLGQVQRWSLVVGGVGLVLATIGLFVWIFWLGMALGSLALTMLLYLVRSRWGLPIQRFAEAGARTLPLVAVLFVPLAFGLGHVYQWTHAAAVAADPLLQHKAPYLNVPFFLIRAVIYFGVWLGLLFVLQRQQAALEDADQDKESLVGRQRALSAVGVLAFALTVTFAYVDWIMSLEPHWFSTMYGPLVAMGQVVAAFAFAIALAVWLGNYSPPLRELLSAQRLNDLGSLLLAFVMLWAYFAYSQFMLIWYGDTVEEIPWYVRRLGGGWEWVALAIALLHFVLPFLLLLSRDLKRDARRVASVAGLLVLVRVIDTFWLVRPAFADTQLTAHWLDIALLLGIGGAWVALFTWQLSRRSLVPPHEYELEGVHAHGQA